MNGYLSLEIGEKTIGFKFGLWVLDKVQEYLGVSVTDIYEDADGLYKSRFDEKLKSDLIAGTAHILLFGAQWDDFINKRTTNNYTIEDAYNWFDEIGLNTEKHKQVLNTFTQALVKDVPVDKVKKK